jgi:hypothetical protein
MSPHPNKDIEIERATAGCGVSRRRAHAAVLGFYLAAALFNGEALLREAHLLRYGPLRDSAIAAARPLAAAARMTRLGRLRAWAERRSPAH